MGERLSINQYFDYSNFTPDETISGFSRFFSINTFTYSKKGKAKKVKSRVRY